MKNKIVIYLFMCTLSISAQNTIKRETKQQVKSETKVTATTTKRTHNSGYSKPHNITNVRSAEEIFEEGKSYYDKGDYGRAFPLFKSSAESGLSKAQVYLGFMYANGFWVTKSYSEANTWFLKAAEQGDAAGEFYLGLSYDIGNGADQNENEAKKWYQKAAEQNYSDAQINLGVLFCGEKKYTDGLSWFRKVAEKGNAKGQYLVGKCYEHGYGVSQDYSSAIYWYKKAAEQNDIDAQSKLGFLYWNGYGTTKDQAEAIKWWQLAANQGDNAAKEKINYYTSPISITGTVLNPKNKPLIGASIMEVGTTNGAATNMNGKFSITLSSRMAKVAVTYVGYKTQYLDALKDNDFTIVLDKE